MRLKTIVTIIDLSYGILLLIPLIGIITSFYLFSGLAFVLACLFCCGIGLFAFLLKSTLITSHLRSCKYPFEFISVLEQLHLNSRLDKRLTTENQLIVSQSHIPTSEFLLENQLKTEINEDKRNSFQSIFSVGLILLIVGGIYLSSQWEKSGGRIILACLAAVLVTILILLQFQRRKVTNDNNPVVRFRDEGLHFYSKLLSWNGIHSWQLANQTDTSEGEVLIKYMNGEKIEEHVANLDRLNIGHLDFLLLMTHFKARYGSQ